MNERSEIPLDALDRVHVSSPCPADWEAMEGTDSVRRCAKCDLHVFNLSALTRAEANELVRATEGRLCVRYFMRHDGKIMTADCRRGLGAIPNQLWRWAASVAALAGLSLGGAACMGARAYTGVPIVREENATTQPDS